MKNIFENIKDKITEKSVKENQEQRRRIDRLRELNDKKSSKKGFHIPHPIQAVKDNREMKELEKEIAAFEEKKKNKWQMLALVAFLVICFGYLGLRQRQRTKEEFNSSITETNEGAEEETIELAEGKTVDDTPDIKLKTNTIVEEESTQEEVVETETTSSNIDEKENEDAEVKENEESTQYSGEYKKVTASQLEIRVKTDYAHFDYETTYLGNDERATITISAPTGTTIEDLEIGYDSEKVSVEQNSIEDDGNNSTICLSVSGKTEGYSELSVFTNYDISIYRDEVPGYFLNIKKYNSSDGRIVYVTPTGQKYHFSETCAGENAIKTTLYDVTVLEYEPCGNCAQ